MQINKVKGCIEEGRFWTRQRNWLRKGIITPIASNQRLEKLVGSNPAV